MKAAIGWAVSWSLYWLGDLVSKPLNAAPDWFPQWYFTANYTVYNRLMCASSCVQGVGGKGPWLPAVEVGK